MNRKFVDALSDDLLLSCFEKLSLKDLCQFAKIDKRFFRLISMFIIPKCEINFPTIIVFGGAENAWQLVKFAKKINVNGDEYLIDEYLLLAANFLQELTIAHSKRSFSRAFKRYQFEFLRVLTFERCHIELSKLKETLESIGPKLEEFHWIKSVLCRRNTFAAIWRLTFIIGRNATNLKALTVKYHYLDLHNPKSEKSK